LLELPAEDDLLELATEAVLLVEEVVEFDPAEAVRVAGDVVCGGTSPCPGMEPVGLTNPVNPRPSKE
jgi:hypothetical protein